MTRFTAAPRLIAPSRKRKLRKAEFQDEMAAGITNREVAFTDAEIKALPTTSLTLVPAQGANTIIIPHRVVLVAVIAAGYTNITADAVMQVALGGGSWTVMASIINGGGTGRTALSQFLNPGQLGTYVLPLGPDGEYDSNWPGMVPTSPLSKSGAANTALELQLDNDEGGNLTGGDAGNSLTAHVWYSVFDV